MTIDELERFWQEQIDQDHEKAAATKAAGEQQAIRDLAGSLQRRAASRLTGVKSPEHQPRPRAMCTCQHTRSQHHLDSDCVYMCDYAGYSCTCTGYHELAATDKRRRGR